MSKLFLQQPTTHTQKPAFVHVFDTDFHPGHNGITIAYNLIFVERERENQFETQILVEYGYSVKSVKDALDKARGRKQSAASLERGEKSANYGIFNLGIAADADGLDQINNLASLIGHAKIELPSFMIPVRDVLDKQTDSYFPWVYNKDFDLTEAVKKQAIKHYVNNPIYE